MHYARKGAWIFRALMFGILFVGLIGFVTMSLWNAIVVSLFAAPVITFWQAIGLLLLGRLITGNFGPRGFRRGPGGPPWMRHRGGGGFWRDRWQTMSEDERQAAIQRWRGRCGPYGYDKTPEQPQESNPE